jgi:hypothetical protein
MLEMLQQFKQLSKAYSDTGRVPERAADRRR